MGGETTEEGLETSSAETIRGGTSPENVFELECQARHFGEWEFLPLYYTEDSKARHIIAFLMYDLPANTHVVQAMARLRRKHGLRPVSEEEFKKRLEGGESGPEICRKLVTYVKNRDEAFIDVMQFITAVQPVDPIQNLRSLKMVTTDDTTATAVLDDRTRETTKTISFKKLDGAWFID